MKKLFLIFVLIVPLIFPVYAEQSTISDIKVQGLKRVDPGLVFDNIPFEVNTPISEAFKNQHNHIVDFLWSLKIVKETLKKDNLELYNILQKQDVKNMLGT